MKEALDDISQIATNAVIASFDRQIQTDASTREIGVSLARPGIAAASVALQVPRSAVPVPPGPATRSRSSISQVQARSDVRDLSFAGLSDCYQPCWRRTAYTSSFLIAKRRNPNRRLLNPIPWWSSSAVPRRDQRAAAAPNRRRRQCLVGSRWSHPKSPVAAAGGTAHGMALDAVDGPLRGQRIAVVGPRFQIGADNNNELRITTDKYLSGMHARIQHSQGQWTVIDLESSNGTFVNGRRLTSGQAHPLHNGESVRMGASEFRVMITPVAASGGSSG